MEKNMSTADRLIRVLVAIVVVGLYFAGALSGGVALVLLVLAGVFLLTSFMGFCPIYYLLGLKKKNL
jgi:fatty acid desaturase